MTCKLEEYSRLYDVLSALRKGYNKGDFGDLFQYLAKDCILESQWVLTPISGYDAVVSYFKGKGETIAESESYPDCSSIVELTGNRSPDDGAPDVPSVTMMEFPGKLCLYMEQTINEEKNGILVDVSLDEDGMAVRIDLCMPELFIFRYLDTYVWFFPTTEEWEPGEEYHEHQDHIVLVSEDYYSELYLFLSIAGFQFDEYDDLCIPMGDWQKALEYWKEFSEASCFDDAFEKTAGVDYESGTVQNPDAARRLGRIGKEIWNNRFINRSMLDNLMEWTDLYKDTHSYINTYGW